MPHGPDRTLRRHGYLLCTVALLAGPVACATTKVSRIDPSAVTDLSGRWNDTDSRLVANQLIQESLGGAWKQQYTSAHSGQPPAVIVGAFSNRSYEHIPLETFVHDLERAYVNSNAVRLVAGADERQDVRSERKDQQRNARSETRAQLGQEQGAKYMLQGEIQSIEDGAGREKVVYYQIDATLVDLESNVKVWAGQHKIKKYIERKRFGV
jgi:hypothetical protein